MKKDIHIDGLQCAVPERAYFKEAVETGMDMIHVTVSFWENSTDTLQNIGNWLRTIDLNSDLIYPAIDSHNLSSDIGNGKLGILFGFQNCSPIENNIDLIQVFRRLNVGIMQLSYNNQSALCGGCYEQVETGLSRFGKKVVREMNRSGMIIDMSHSCEKSTREAIEHSERPIVISHAQSLSFRKALRNKSDQLLKLLGESGGMLGMSFYPFHLKNQSDCSLTEIMDELKRLIDLMGIDHVGVGSDLCQGQTLQDLEYMRNGKWTKELDYGEGSADKSGWPEPVSWFSEVKDFAEFGKKMLQHGFSAEETAKILGINWQTFLQSSLRPLT